MNIEKKNKTTIYISQKLHLDAVEYCINNKTTLSKLIEKFLYKAICGKKEKIDFHKILDYPHD